MESGKFKRELPDPIAYDSAFRTMLNKCPKLILPVLNELFNENYQGDESVLLLNSSNFLRKPGLRDERRQPDSIMVPGNRTTDLKKCVNMI